MMLGDLKTNHATKSHHDLADQEAEKMMIGEENPIEIASIERRRMKEREDQVDQLIGKEDLDLMIQEGRRGVAVVNIGDYPEIRTTKNLLDMIKVEKTLERDKEPKMREEVRKEIGSKDPRKDMDLQKPHNQSQKKK
jgi:hypothetical protein